MGSDDTYNFYAIVLDSQFPHKSFKSDRFLCTMKIADPSCNIEKIDDTVDYCSLVFFAKRFEDLPICQRTGDIIRVHRAHVGNFKGIKQFTSNIFFNSSWALFSPYSLKDRIKDDRVEDLKGNKVEEDSKKAKVDAREFMPFNYYGKTFSFEKSEQKIINQHRDWISKNFAKHSILSNRYITSLKDVPEHGKKKENGKYYDFDLQVKIVQLFKLDDYSSELRVIDDSYQIWFCQVLNMKYRWLREGQYVRIRGATLEHHDRGYERTFGLKNYSNILSLPYPCHLVKGMKLDYEKVDKAGKEMDQEFLLHEEKIMHPVIATQVTNPSVKSQYLRSFEYIYNENKPGEVYRVRFSVQATQPSIDNFPLSSLKIQNKVTKAFRDLPKTQAALKKDERYILYLQLYVTDHHSQLSNHVTRLSVYEPLDKTSTLFGNIKAEDIIKKKEVQDKIKVAMEQLRKFNVWCEGAVRVNHNGLLVLVDTQIKEY